MKPNVIVFIFLALVTIAILAFTTSEVPKTASSEFGEMYGPIWANAQKQVLDIAEAMPEDKYIYRPSDVSRTFAEQMMHIGYASKYIAEAYLKGVQAEYSEASAEGKSKAEIVSYLKENLAACGEIFGELSDEELKQEITTFSGNTMPKQQLIMFIHDHLTNHKAKANLYIRMNGIEPPQYAYY